MDEIAQLIANGELHQALEKLDAFISTNKSAQALSLRGNVLWRLGRHGEAISDYHEAVALDPDSPAKVALEMANDVMDFFNTDFLNP